MNNLRSNIATTTRSALFALAALSNTTLLTAMAPTIERMQKDAPPSLPQVNKKLTESIRSGNTATLITALAGYALCAGWHFHPCTKSPLAQEAHHPAQFTTLSYANPSLGDCCCSCIPVCIKCCSTVNTLRVIGALNKPNHKDPELLARLQMFFDIEQTKLAAEHAQTGKELNDLLQALIKKYPASCAHAAQDQELQSATLSLAEKYFYSPLPPFFDCGCEPSKKRQAGLFLQHYDLEVHSVTKSN